MKSQLAITIGRVLVVSSVALLFLAYSNFAPTALSSDLIADYVKNHFVREIIFGCALAAWAARLALKPIDSARWMTLAVVGSIVVLPFWIAALFGWLLGGMEEVWGDSLSPSSAYLLHGPQVVMFYVGLVLLKGARHPLDVVCGD